MKYDDRMDPECVALCDVLNTLPGIRTFESCCGHGEDPFRVFFWADGMVSLLLPIVRAISSSGWKLECCWCNGPDMVCFVLVGPKDPGAGNELVESIRREQPTGERS